jgi:DNA-binding winged helix-turn-helix (wHTH) protein/TolB-like protein
MSYSRRYFYEFGDFRLNVADRVLLRSDEVVKLMPKTIETLLILTQRKGQVVGKEELLQALWPDVVVEENNLSQHISALRKALGQDNNGNKFIETVPRRGYRFVAEVREVIEPEAAVITPVQLGFVAVQCEAPPAGATEVVTGPSARSAAGLRRRRWWLLAGPGLLFVLGMAWLLVGQQWLKLVQPSEIAEVKSIAVLPFKFLQSQAGEEEQGLGVGIADNLINRLGRLSQLVVRPVRAVSRYADTQHDPLVAGRELRVDAVLDGGVQRAKERLRVSVRLLRVKDGKTLWADQFDGQFNDIFAVQDWIANRIIRALALELTKQQRDRLARRYTANVAAWQAYTKGRYFWNQRTVPALGKAIEHFEQAVKEDQHYALAHSGLADAWVLLGVFNGVPPQEAAAKAGVAARRALELDEEIAEAHASLAVLKAWYEWEWVGAEQEYRRALELNPSYATAHQWHGLMLANLGRGQEAIAELKCAQ